MTIQMMPDKDVATRNFSLEEIIEKVVQQGGRKTSINLDEATTQVIEEFSALTKIPHPSGHEKKISDYLYNHIKKMGLSVERDDYLNLIVNKPAAKGRENDPLVILQAHMDMVAVGSQENPDFDPLRDHPILINDGKTLKSKNSSLGLDNGIGLSMLLYILKTDLDMGPIRVIITTDEERGMTGARGLDVKHLQDAKYLINMDGMDENAIIVGCAGSLALDITKEPTPVAPKNDLAIKLCFKGLSGGHSGLEVNQGRINSIVELGNILERFRDQDIDFELASFNGGQAHNAIPGDASATIVIPKEQFLKIQNLLEHIKNDYRKVYLKTEPNFNLEFEYAEIPAKVLSAADTKSVVAYIVQQVNGVYNMSWSYDETVQSCCNLGIIRVDPDNIRMIVLARSFAEMFLDQMYLRNKNLANLLNLNIRLLGRDPAWTPKTTSALVDSLYENFKEVFGKEPQVKPYQAGFEPAWFYAKNSNLDIITMGPNIKNPHSPYECVEIESVKKSFQLLIETLKNFNRQQTEDLSIISMVG